MRTYLNPARALRFWFPTVLDTGPRMSFRRWLSRLIPEDLNNPEQLPLVVLTRYGGFDPVVSLDDGNIDAFVYVTGPDPMRADDIAVERADDIRWAVRTQLVGTVLEDPGDEDNPYPEPKTAAVSRVRTIAGPTLRPYDARGGISRAHFGFQVRLHNQM